MHGYKKPKYNQGKKGDSNSGNKGNRSDDDGRFGDKFGKLKKKKARQHTTYDEDGDDDIYNEYLK